MAQILRQSTAVDVLIGPFVDIADGSTAETGESPSVKLSKNGQTLAAKNDVTTPVHDADGYYNCELDATDTNTVGTLVLTVAASANALPVRHEFVVIEEATYDFLWAANATPIADINAEVDTGISDAALATAAALATVDTNVDAILVDTGTTLPATLATAAALATVDANVDAILVDTGTTIPAQITALNDISVSDILTTQMTESYAADGAAPTLAQALCMIQQMLGDFSISGTTLTLKKVDGSTTAATFTLDDATSPTSITRAS